MKLVKSHLVLYQMWYICIPSYLFFFVFEILQQTIILQWTQHTLIRNRRIGMYKLSVYRWRCFSVHVYLHSLKNGPWYYREKHLSLTSELLSFMRNAAILLYTSKIQLTYCGIEKSAFWVEFVVFFFALYYESELVRVLFEFFTILTISILSEIWLILFYAKKLFHINSHFKN